MPRMIRSLATLLILLVTATTAWGAGEREVTIAQGIDAEFLDVQMTNNVATIIINGSIYDTLMTRDKQLQIVPHLATSYKLVSDKVWEVKLRPGVKFHNGEAIDAHWTGKPAVRRATWRPIPELGSRIAALQTGQADLIVNVPPDQIAALSPNKNIRIEKTPSCRIVSFAIAQIKGGALGDKRVDRKSTRLNSSH